MVSVRLAENDDDIKKIADLAEIIWHEYFSSLLSPEQIDYMVEKFQSYKAISEAVNNAEMSCAATSAITMRAEAQCL